MLEALIFDVDGTLIDTELAMLNSLQRTLLEEKNKIVSHDEIRFILGIPGKDALRKMNLEPVDALYQIWSDAVLDFFHDVTVFDGIQEALVSLKKQEIKLGIVTSKTKVSMRAEFKQFHLTKFFTNIIDADDTEKHKPDPQPLEQSLKNLKVKAERAIYIGDSIYDMQSAHAAGMKFALALWGAKTSVNFEKADFILKEPSELLLLLTDDF